MSDEGQPLYMSDAEFRAHPKVKRALELLREVGIEFRAARKARSDAMRCRCEHRHDQHGPSHSINYTAGRCLEEGCDCIAFVSAPAGKAAA